MLDQVRVKQAQVILKFDLQHRTDLENANRKVVTLFQLFQREVHELERSPRQCFRFVRPGTGQRMIGQQLEDIQDRAEKRACDSSGRWAAES